MAPRMERFEMRIDDESLARIDAWSREQADRPVRAEAVRRLIDLGLSAGSERSVRFSDGEKMLILMMSDLFKRLNLRGGDTDPEFLAKVIFNGHYWAPKWEMQGVFHDHVDDPEEVRYVADVLDMWTLIERAYESFTEEERKALLDEAGVRAESVQFPGFDGNNETSQLGIARFLIEEMGRFQTFKGRGLNSHHTTEGRYCRMLERFAPMRQSMIGANLTVRQVIELLS